MGISVSKNILIEKNFVNRYRKQLEKDAQSVRPIGKTDFLIATYRSRRSLS